MESKGHWKTVEKHINKRLLPLLSLIVLPAVLLLNCQCRFEPGQPPDEVIVQLKGRHQAEFAGFYLAQEKGYYSQENINVTFFEGEKDLAIVQRIVYQQADFAVIAPESVLVARSQDQPVTAVAAIYRQSPIVYVALFDSGILRPRDFLGKTVATLDASGSQQDLQLQFDIMMKRLGLDISRTKLIAWDPVFTTFYGGEVDITSCYSNTSLIEMRQKGLKLNLIWPSDYGVYFYSDLVVTRESLIKDNPDLVARFLRATLRGWQDAVEDYEQAIPAVLKYNKGKDPQLQAAMLEAQLPLVHTGDDYIGWMKPEDWQSMYQTLLDYNLLAKPFDVNQAYTMQFLYEIYGSESR
ncbi:MAG: ABC transporter substrate-binding protein [Dehalococcoidia bacterium]|nr:ABC transporter substrate-binding protein [Dehalococcoidia bacterium]